MTEGFQASFIAAATTGAGVVWQGRSAWVRVRGRGREGASGAERRHDGAVRQPWQARRGNGATGEGATEPRGNKAMGEGAAPSKRNGSH